MFGPLLALVCAMTWSSSVILFKKCDGKIHPLALNFCKNTLAFILMIPTWWFIEGIPKEPITALQWVTCIISGILGLGAADLLFLSGLNRIGATRTAMVDCLYSPSVMALSFVFLGETLIAQQFIGFAAILLAIIVANSAKRDKALNGQPVLKGILMVATGVFFMAAGIVMVKPLFSIIPLFTIISIRLCAGLIFSAATFLLHPNHRLMYRSLVTSPHKKLLFTASILSSYISMMFWVSSFKFSAASVAAIINQTATIFTVVFACIFLGEILTRRIVFATIMAFVGVILITTA